MTPDRLDPLPARTTRRWIGWATLGLFAVLLTLDFCKTVTMTLGHDEPLYVAGGQFWARQHLIPHRDFSFIHMPNLVFVYGVLFKLVDHNFLAARLLQMTMGLATCGMIFALGLRSLGSRRPSERFVFAAAMTLLLFFSPLFIWTSGRTWAHDLCVCLAVGAFFVELNGLRRGVLWPLILAGFLLGLAAGARLSFGPPLLGYMALPLIYRGGVSWKRRATGCVGVGLGFGLAMLLPLWLFALAPEEFLFDNLGLRRFNYDWYVLREWTRGMTLLSKLRLLAVDVLARRPSELATVLLFLVLVVTRSLRGWRREFPCRNELTCAVVVLGFLLVSAMLSTPVERQYFYPVIPFVLVCAIYLTAGLSLEPNPRRWPLTAAVGVAVFAVALGIGRYRHVDALWSQARWYPAQFHTLAEDVTSLAGPGRVLTLYPALPLEGGSNSYPDLAPGVFVWRIGHVIPDEVKRARVGLYKENLADRLRNDPPAAVLTGFEGPEETPLVLWAESHGYQPRQLRPSSTLIPDKYVGNPVVLWLPAPTPGASRRR